MRNINLHKLADEARFNSFHRLVLFWCALIIIFDGYDLAVAGIALPSIMTEMGVSPTNAGFMVSSALFGMMFGAIFLGTIADKIGRRLTIVICVALFSVFTAAAGLTNDPVTFSVMRFLAGLGIGGVMPNVVARMTEYSPRKIRSTMVDRIASGSRLPAGGWRPFRAAGRGQGGQRTDQPPVPGGSKLMAGAGYALGSALTFVLVLNFGAMIGAVAHGLADRFHIKYVLVGMYALAAVSISLLVYPVPTAILFLLVGLAGASTIGTQIVTCAYVGQFCPMALRATGIGWASGVGRSGAILAPIVIGALVGLSLPLQQNFIAIAIPALIAAVAVALINHDRSTGAHRKDTHAELREPSPAAGKTDLAAK